VVTFVIVLLAGVDKLVWLKWGPAGIFASYGPLSVLSRHVALEWHPWVVTDYVDLVSDTLLTALGAALFLYWHSLTGWTIALTLLYILGTFNGE
jgi:hypothetical protein